MILTVVGCRSPEIPRQLNPDAAAPGSLRTVARLAHYPTLKSRTLVWWAGLSDALPVAYGLTLYRVEYWTTGTTAEPTYASGLVALPSGARFRGVVSYQHPTRTQRTNVPSTPSRTALLAAIAFAGHGYILVAPDYVGLGSSPGSHPYLHAVSEATSVIDLLRGARLLVQHLGHQWPETLFLTGFSQGGHASLAAQRSLEAQPVDGMRVAAAAPIAGTYNLSGIQFASALQGHSRSHAAYLAYLTTAYARVYAERLESVLEEPYAHDVPALFDGSLAFDDVAAALPADPSPMFRPGFLRAFASGDETWLTRALRLNDVFDWRPRAPIRFYYGTDDLDSPAADTLFTVEHMRNRGGQVSAVNVGHKDHNAVVLAALPEIRKWFDAMTLQTR